jgi:hypothetical protein
VKEALKTPGFSLSAPPSLKRHICCWMRVWNWLGVRWEEVSSFGGDAGIGAGHTFVGIISLTSYGNKPQPFYLRDLI